MIRLIVLLVLLFPSASWAATIFSEDYEVTTGAIGTVALQLQGTATGQALAARGWTGAFCSSDPCTTSVASVTSRTGASTSALKMTYSGLAFSGTYLIPDNDSAIAHTFSSTPEIYVRYWAKFECTGSPCGFTEYGEGGSNGGSKQHYFNNDSYPNFYTIANLYSDGQMSAVNQSQVSHLCPNGNTGVTCVLPTTEANVPLTFNQWHCIETHLGQNIIELWVDNTRTMLRTSLLQTPSGYNKILLFRQPGNNMVRWEDDLLVSTTRVGCGGGAVPSIDSTAPSTPTGLAVN